MEGYPPYPVDKSGLSNRIGAIAADEGWAAEFTKAVYRAWFLAHQDFGLPEVVKPILSQLGQDPDIVIQRANDDAGKQKFDINTDEARKLGVFGAPSFVVDGEVFWGHDRLDDALKRVSTGNWIGSSS